MSNRLKPAVANSPLASGESDNRDRSDGRTPTHGLGVSPASLLPVLWQEKKAQDQDANPTKEKNKKKRGPSLLSRLLLGAGSLGALGVGGAAAGVGGGIHGLDRLLQYDPKYMEALAAASQKANDPAPGTSNLDRLIAMGRLPEIMQHPLYRGTSLAGMARAISPSVGDLVDRHSTGILRASAPYLAELTNPAAEAESLARQAGTVHAREDLARRLAARGMTSQAEAVRRIAATERRALDAATPAIDRPPPTGIWDRAVRGVQSVVPSPAAMLQGHLSDIGQRAVHAAGGPAPTPSTATGDQAYRAYLARRDAATRLTPAGTPDEQEAKLREAIGPWAAGAINAAPTSMIESLPSQLFKPQAPPVSAEVQVKEQPAPGYSKVPLSSYSKALAGLYSAAALPGELVNAAKPYANYLLGGGLALGGLGAYGLYRSLWPRKRDDDEEDKKQAPSPALVSAVRQQYTDKPLPVKTAGASTFSFEYDIKPDEREYDVETSGGSTKVAGQRDALQRLQDAEAQARQPRASAVVDARSALEEMRAVSNRLSQHEHFVGGPPVSEQAARGRLFLYGSDLAPAEPRIPYGDPTRLSYSMSAHELPHNLSAPFSPVLRSRLPGTPSSSPLEEEFKGLVARAKRENEREGDVGRPDAFRHINRAVRGSNYEALINMVRESADQIGDDTGRALVRLGAAESRASTLRQLDELSRQVSDARQEHEAASTASPRSSWPSLGQIGLGAGVAAAGGLAGYGLYRLLRPKKKDQDVKAGLDKQAQALGNLNTIRTGPPRDLSARTPAEGTQRRLMAGAYDPTIASQYQAPSGVPPELLLPLLGAGGGAVAGGQDDRLGGAARGLSGGLGAALGHYLASQATGGDIGARIAGSAGGGLLAYLLSRYAIPPREQRRRGEP